MNTGDREGESGLLTSGRGTGKKSQFQEKSWPIWKTPSRSEHLAFKI